jgi:ADP-heptose:LPS heptosyltransferase
LELLIPLDIHSPKVQWKLPLSTTARTWANRWRRSIPANRLAVLNPGATWASKAWEADRFGAVARYAADRHGYRSVVVWGTFEERLMAEAIVASSHGTATLAPDTDLHHLGAMIETADLFISGDTGPLHMAVAVGTATRPGDSGPYGQIAIQKTYQEGSRTQRRRADNTAMRSITVADVCEAVDQIESQRQLKAAG